MTTVSLPPLDDESFVKRLRAACLRRYIRIPEETLNFLEPRLERSYQAIEAFVSALDVSMSETGRPPTIPLARDILDALTEANEQDEY
jgi:chromosomal replication initiation ATPase DnaA